MQICQSPGVFLFLDLSLSSPLMVIFFMKIYCLLGVMLSLPWGSCLTQNLHMNTTLRSLFSSALQKLSILSKAFSIFCHVSISSSCFHCFFLLLSIVHQRGPLLLLVICTSWIELCVLLYGFLCHGSVISNLSHCCSINSVCMPLKMQSNPLLFFRPIAWHIQGLL